PQVVCECPDVDMLLDLVNEGIGATIIPESALSRLHLQGVKKMTIKDANIIARSAVIWLKDRYLPKSASRFIELFQKIRKDKQYILHYQINRYFSYKIKIFSSITIIILHL